LSNREHLNESLQEVIDAQTEPWGIKVTSVEIKDVEIPERMQHAIARQAEAERERRAKIINAEGEFQAAAKLADAADVIGRNPVTLQLRYLQTLREIGVNQNSTVVFPMPIDLMKPMLEVLGSASASASANGSADEAQRAVGHAAELRTDPAPELTSEPLPELGAAIVGLELDTGVAPPAESEPAREVDAPVNPAAAD
jgi:regulator of protease activity HflC (stomatin/prohibitin superfamily)